MKTLDETKEDLEVWGVGVLVDDGYGNFRPPGIWQGNAAEVCRNALACIQTLESTYSQVSKSLVGKKNATLEELLQAVDQLKTNIAQVERERDACIKDIQQCQGAICNSCKHHYRPNPEIRRYACAILGEFDTFLEDGEGKPFVCGRFEWRGICEENTKEK